MLQNAVFIWKSELILFEPFYLSLKIHMNPLSVSVVLCLKATPNGVGRLLSITIGFNWILETVIVLTVTNLRAYLHIIPYKIWSGGL